MAEQMGWSLLSFLFVVACIPAALWLLRRSPVGAGVSTQVTRTVGVTPVGPQERIVTVEVGQGDERQWLVLGVTPHGISHLHTLAPQSLPATAASTPMPASIAGLAPWLARMRTGLPGSRP